MMTQHTDAISPAPPIPREPLIADPVTRCRVRLVTTDAEFDALEGEWNRLLERANTTIYQTYEWQRTWWKYLATKQDRLHIVLFQYDDALVGIAPLYSRRFFGVTHLQMIGHGLSDYCDFLVQTGFEQMVYDAFALHLRASSRAWDVLDIEDVNETSPLLKQLPGTMENHEIRSFLYQGNVCPWIPLPATAETLMESMGTSTAANFRRKLKCLNQNFSVETSVIQNESDDIEHGIDEFSRIHGERWKSLGHPSAFDDPAFRAFHVEFSRKFARRGWLRLRFLHVDGVARAVNFEFHYDKRIYMYHSNAHGPENVMKCSPGIVSRKLTIEQGILEGMKFFDFLRGDESYKYIEWKATDSKNYLLRLSSPALMARPRFIFFLAVELAGKGVARSRRELYDYRRFLITGKRSPMSKLGYLSKKTGEMMILAYNFTLRHSPIKALHRLQVAQRTPQEGKKPS